MCTMNPDLTSGQRLMAESQHMGVEVKVAADKLDRLEVQNAKLREMAAQALQIIKRVNVVMAIDYARYSALMSMARELEIEVDG